MIKFAFNLLILALNIIQNLCILYVCVNFRFKKSFTDEAGFLMLQLTSWPYISMNMGFTYSATRLSIDGQSPESSQNLHFALNSLKRYHRRLNKANVCFREAFQYVQTYVFQRFEANKGHGMSNSPLYFNENEENIIFGIPDKQILDRASK